MVSPTTPEIHQRTKRVEYTNTEHVDRQYSDDKVETDVYTITTGDPNDPVMHTRKVNAVSIGCPDCKQNATAVLHGGKYHCACGYESEASSTTLLLQGTKVDGVWKPY